MDVTAKKEIGHSRQKAVTPASGELLRREIASAINSDVGISSLYSLFPLAYQSRKILRIIFHISILHSYQITSNVTKAGTQSNAFAFIAPVAYITIGIEWCLLTQFLQNFPSAICRGIINNNYFHI